MRKKKTISSYLMILYDLSLSRSNFQGRSNHYLPMNTILKKTKAPSKKRRNSKRKCHFMKRDDYRRISEQKKRELGFP
jgi:hypothetical protein